MDETSKMFTDKIMKQFFSTFAKSEEVFAKIAQFIS